MEVRKWEVECNMSEKTQITINSHNKHLEAHNKISNTQLKLLFENLHIINPYLYLFIEQITFKDKM